MHVCVVGVHEALVIMLNRLNHFAICFVGTVLKLD